MRRAPAPHLLCALACASLLAACGGKDGEDGAVGSRGQDGQDGEDGAVGGDGEEGAQGEDGEDGDDGTDGEDARTTDEDGDGVFLLDDCDDTDAAIGGPATWYIDYDGDGFGYVGVALEACEVLAGWVDNADDCDDLDEAVNPDAQEVCSGVDDDCDGTIDDDDTDVDTTDGDWFYVDLDFDGYGDEATAQTQACAETSGLSAEPGDCDDTASAVNPGQAEVCGNSIDDDCSGDANDCGISSGWASDQADATWLALDDGNRAGYDIAAAGDVDGDGYEDLVVGAHWDDDGGSSAGAAYLVYGAATPTSGSLDTGTLKATGDASSDNLGEYVDGAGDINGDGYDDVLVGSDSTETAYLVYGAATAFTGTYDISLLAGLTIDGSSVDGFGGVAGVGDLDGDGYADLSVSATYGDSDSGAVYLWYGTTSSAGTTTPASADAMIEGASSYDFLGRYGDAITAGDWDGDGLRDLAIGAPSEDSVASGGGQVMVFEGTGSRLSGTFLTTDADVTIDSDDTSGDAFLGQSIANIGDQNGDGTDDLAMGAHYYDSAAYDAGGAFVFYGSASGWTSTDLASADVTVTGVAMSDYAGRHVAGGDLDGDGLSDLVVGAYAADAGGSSAGSVGVLLGASAGTGGSWDLDTVDARIDGDTSSLSLGHGLTVFDMDADGTDDLVVSGYGESSVFWFQGGGL
jgi:hypothetical protein